MLDLIALRAPAQAMVSAGGGAGLSIPRGPNGTKERDVMPDRPVLTAGVDEAGRGPLAGPVAAAAVILDPARIPGGIADSKILTETARERLFGLILKDAVAVSFCLLPPADVDRLNIRAASLEAMRRAVAGLAIQPQLALIDGRDVPPGLPCLARAIVGGDGSEPAIGAASIVAKVMRDRLMTRLGAELPAYGFEVHKGYGTLKHRQAAAEHGLTAHHRLSFAPFKNGTQPDRPA
jgi:ribonuclease HII